MGKKMDFLLGRMAPSRSLPKLKTLLTLTISRLAVARNRRQLRRDEAHGDVARLLQLGHVDDALLRVEQEIKEHDMLDVLSMIENCCHLLADRYMLLDHKECPEELREAVSSLVFAAPRCAGELPELDDVRRIFSSKYGKGFVSAIVELRSDSLVNAEMIQKLSTERPTLEIKQRMAKEIATRKGITLEFCEISSEIAESQEQLESRKNPSPRTHQQYNDAATAAQAAFESAAFAAIAARAAVQLCRSESQKKVTNKGENGNRSSSQSSIEVEKPRSSININKPGKNSMSFEKKTNQERNSGSHPEERAEKMKVNQIDSHQNERMRDEQRKQMRRSPSSSSSSSDEGDYNASIVRDHLTGFKGKSILFDKTGTEVERGMSLGSKLRFDGTNYLSSPINGENEARSSEKVELGTQTEDKIEVKKLEDTHQGCVNKKMSMLYSSSGKKAMSVRTRR